MTLGFYAAPEKPCDHKGSIETGNVCGFGIRQCTACGRSWSLGQLDNGFLGWVLVKEQNEFEGQQVTLVRGMEDVGEDVLPMPGSEALDGLLLEPDPSGRERPFVPQLPDIPESLASTSDGKEALQ